MQVVDLKGKMHCIPFFVLCDVETRPVGSNRKEGWTRKINKKNIR